MSISQSLLLSGLISFGFVSADSFKNELYNVVDATASKLYITTMVGKVSNYSTFLSNHQTGINRAAVAVVTAAALVGLYKLYETLCVDAGDNCPSDEYADMFDGFDDAAADADMDNEEEVVVEVN